MADKPKEIPDQMEKLNQVRSNLADRLETLEESLDRVLAQQSTSSVVEQSKEEKYESSLACDLNEEILGLSLLVQKIDSLIERLQI